MEAGGHGRGAALDPHEVRRRTAGDRQELIEGLPRDIHAVLP